MAETIHLILEGFDGDNVILGVRGSKYNGRSFYFKPKTFVEFLKVMNSRPLKSQSIKVDFAIEISENIIEIWKKFLH